MKLGRFTVKGMRGQGDDEYNDPPRPFLEHLLELRDCLLRCAIAWVTCILVIIPFAPRVTQWLLAPAGGSKDMVQGLEWSAGVNILLKIMLWGGTVLSLPFLLFFILKFVFPGLKRSERTSIVICLGFSTLLFMIGVWLAYAQTLQIALQVFQKINTWVGVKVDIVRMDEHVGIVVKMILAFGLALQLPLLLLVLGWIGVIPSSALKKQRRLAVVIIFILAMVLTPPDPVSQIVMAVPMCVLYEVCIWVVRLRELTRGATETDKAPDA